MIGKAQTLRGFQQRLAAESVSNLAGVLGRWILPAQRTALRQGGRRRRVFTPLATFWNFLAQVLSPPQPCRETVRHIQAARQARRQVAISSSTGAYCQARRRLPETVLETLWPEVARRLAATASVALHWSGYRVGVIDGTTVTMPDTAQNQAVWPQPSGQKPGCGFPLMKMLGLFSLATGAVHAVVTGTLHNAEHALLAPLWKELTANFDLLLGDRNFGSFATFAALQISGRQGVFRLHQGRRINWRQGRHLGKYDRLLTWTRPPKLTWWLPQSIPDSMTVRVLRVCVPIPGFRTRVLFLTTTLLDPQIFPADALAELYRRRWQVELFFRDIKTILHLDVLRCLSPDMIRRELHMHLIAYNLIRALMLEAALLHSTDLHRLSFKGTCDTLRQWAPHLAFVAANATLCRHLYRALLHTLAADLLPLRPHRSEPRAVKRRPKNYHLLTKPRHLMGNLPHRNRPK